ncbi:MAG: penicillin-binding protein 1A [Burkholderiaceae bacterium]
MTQDSKAAPAASANFAKTIAIRVLLGLAGVFAAILLCAAIAVAAVYPNLPALSAVTDYKPKIPLRVFTADGALIGEFGEERRTFVRIEDVPDQLKKAILAIEDDRFYEHSGVDFVGIIRATLSNVAGGTGGGASTITQQVARNFFLTSNEPTMRQKLQRKFYEILLSLKIEANLSKDQILELYINQIFLGQRAYGFAAASRTYFGKNLKDLTVAESAMLAGIPKFPSSANPVANLKRATVRQQYILQRMRDLRYITPQQYEAAIKEQLVIRQSASAVEVPAEYVAEMARMLVFEKFKDETYTRGLNVITTILKDDQLAAYDAFRAGLMAYERRQVYRGPEAFIQIPTGKEAADEAIEDALLEYPAIDQFQPAVVLEVARGQVRAQIANSELITLSGEGVRVAQSALAANAPATRAIRRGAVIRVTKNAKGNWEIVQIPEVEGAFVTANPNNGAVRALIGGFDFNRNKFNHVTQSQRQPGSAFKPFVYSATLEKGFTPATLINDAPVIVDATTTGGQLWEPKNYDGKFDGPLRMRQALAKSKNMVSIRLLQAVGPQYAQDWVTRFGFEADKHPPYLTLALGAGAVSPWEMLGGYSVFANGGYRVNPFIIFKVTDQNGNVVMQANPARAGVDAPQAIDPRNAYMMWSMMQDVVRSGTATRALSLKRSDIGGKTGTTNDSHDAWFAGFNNQIVGVAWVGFDQPKNLGDRETGGGVALPIWINYMAKVLPKLPEVPRPAPSGLTNIGGEIYFSEYIPGQGVSGLGLSDPLPTTEEQKKEEAKEQIF